MKFLRTKREVPTNRNNRHRTLSYRWTTGYIQLLSSGSQVFPALSYNDARALAKQANQKMEIVEK